MAGICERTPVPTGASSPSPARRAAHDHIATPATNRDSNPQTILERPWPPGEAIEDIDRSFDRRIIKADVPRITRHSTRKTCGSLLAALDVHPRVAMQILRHSRVSITMEIYTEVRSASTREALRKLGQWLEDTQT